MFNIGDVVEYSNKRDRADLTGVIIAKDNDYFCVETLSGNTGRNRNRCSFYRFVSDNRSRRDFDGTRFEQGVMRQEFRTISEECQWIPKKSRNLKSAMRDYDPTQAGDTDEDI
jgi:hypothetical protein